MGHCLFFQQNYTIWMVLCLLTMSVVQTSILVLWTKLLRCAVLLSTCALWMIPVDILVAMHWIYSTMYILYMRACTVAVHQMLSDSKTISVFDTQGSTTFHLEPNPCPFPCIRGGTRQLSSESCHKRSCHLRPLVGHSNTATVVKKTMQWQY